MIPPKSFSYSQIVELKKTGIHLSGDLISLRLFTAQDLSDEYISWLNDPIVCRYNRHIAGTYSREKAQLYFAETQASSNSLVFAIEWKLDGKHVGNIGLQAISEADFSGEIGILIGNQDYWGKGIASEAIRLIQEFSFTELGLHRLSMGFFSGNVGMRKSAERSGFQREGLRRQALLKNGSYYDLEYWASLNDQPRVISKRRIEQKIAATKKQSTKSGDFGKARYHDKLHYCMRCCMPETNEGIKFDEMGICQACQSQEQKIHINWAEREIALANILDEYRNKTGENYDCLVPISGGKDSCFQLHVLVKKYGIKPLACTFSHNWFTDVGKFNLWNILEKLDIDHVMFTPNRGLINKLARKSLTAIGDSCWHCHMGVGAYPLQVAVQYKIPLLVWGESIAENSGRASYYDPVKFDRDYFLKVSAKVPADYMVGEGITKQDMRPFQNPSIAETEGVGIVGIHLGDYIFWDHERQVEFLKDEYGWMEDDVEGTYKRYKSVECKMPGVHDYAKFVKRGFGRATDHVSQDVRAGILTREEGFELAKKYDAERPAALDEYLKIAGYTDEEFHQILRAKRQGKAKDLD